MARSKKNQEPEVPEPVAAPIIHRLYLQELFHRTELERQAAMTRVRGELSIPEGMAFNQQAGVFMVPPTVPAPTGPELLPDESD